MCGRNGGHLLARNGDLYGKRRDSSSSEEELLFADPNVAPVSASAPEGSQDCPVLPQLYLQV